MNGIPGWRLGPPRQRPFGEQGGFQRGAVAAESADDLHPERHSGGVAQPGTFTQGVPMMVHSRLKIAWPVEPIPCGAAPGAEGVRIASNSPIRSASASRARFTVRRASS